MNDPSVEQQLEQAAVALRQRLGRRAYQLRIVLRGDGVVLQGQACNYYTKQLAQHTVIQGVGLPVVANEIEVRSLPPSPDTRDRDGA